MSKLPELGKTEIIHKFSEMRVSCVKFDGRHISLTFDKKRLSSMTLPHYEKVVADWSRKRKEVYYDKRIKKNDLIPILVHEVVEKYVAQKFHLNVDKDAHRIAQAVEKTFVIQHEEGKHPWLAHQIRIEKVWEQENKKKSK